MSLPTEQFYTKLLFYNTVVLGIDYAVLRLQLDTRKNDDQAVTKPAANLEIVHPDAGGTEKRLTLRELDKLSRADKLLEACQQNMSAELRDWEARFDAR